jgi:hypothetical protein
VKEAEDPDDGAGEGLLFGITLEDTLVLPLDDVDSGADPTTVV